MIPLLLRPETNREAAAKRLDRFVAWVHATPGLERIAANEMAMYAVAQHYGIPTHLVDFTIDPAVAGFFAFDTDRAIPAGSTSVIVCLDTKDLLSIALPDDMPKPRCLSIDVSDLWRLQAQRGVFLVCPHSHFEEVGYTFDRIVFPFGPPGPIDRMKVYPARIRSRTSRPGSAPPSTV